MRILVLHNRYQQAGGEDVVVQAETALLRSHGDDVRLVEANNELIVGSGSKIRAASNLFFSTNWKRVVDLELHSFRPDVVHVHNLFPVLSPSVLFSCADARVPVIQTVHNFRLFCPNALFFRDGAVCEECIGKRIAWPGIIRGCYRRSRPGTLAVALSSAIHHAIGTYERKVTRYIALTQYASNKLQQCGLPSSKITVKPNFLGSDPGAGDGCGGHALFVGRLSPEKGIQFLLETWRKMRSGIPLKIIGDGPLAEACRSAAAELDTVDYLGPKSASEVYAQMGKAQVLVCPSLWYEGFPRTIVESFGKGTPVIASNLGSMAEVVSHGRTGLLFEAGSQDALQCQVNWILENRKEWNKYRTNARQEFQSRYSADQNYRMLTDIYREAIESFPYETN